VPLFTWLARFRDYTWTWVRRGGLLVRRACSRKPVHPHVRYGRPALEQFEEILLPNPSYNPWPSPA
jgi:hypothetical protein